MGAWAAYDVGTLSDPVAAVRRLTEGGRGAASQPEGGNVPGTAMNGVVAVASQDATGGGGVLGALAASIC